MTDERHTFESTRVRLDEILVAVRKKDTSLEQSLELLEEGVRLANLCNELIDQTSWKPAEPAEGEAAAGDEGGEGVPVDAGEAGDAAVDAQGAEPASAETPEAHAAADIPADDERD
jgi:exodeoxyribonuclease VII small subunit